MCSLRANTTPFYIRDLNIPWILVSAWVLQPIPCNTEGWLSVAHIRSPVLICKCSKVIRDWESFSDDEQVWLKYRGWGRKLKDLRLLAALKRGVTWSYLDFLRLLWLLQGKGQSREQRDNLKRYCNNIGKRDMFYHERCRVKTATTKYFERSEAGTWTDAFYELGKEEGNALHGSRCLCYSDWFTLGEAVLLWVEKMNE